MTVSIVFRPDPTSPMREAVEKQASRFGLDEEVLDVYDRLIRGGSAECEAAWSALYEWDCLDIVGEEKE